MTKFYIISTHKLDPSLSERVFGFDSSYRKEIEDREWSQFFHFLDGFYNREWHFFYELPVRGGSNVRVIAIHDLPRGNDAMCPRWSESLCRFFSDDEEDEVTLILHDLDLLPMGRNHFYHETYHLGHKAVRVFGFHHGDDDIIGRRICSTYPDSDSFSVIMDPVLNAAHLNTILEDCSAELRYPNQNEWGLLQSQFESEPTVWTIRYPDATSCDYLDYLESLCLNLLRPFFI